MDREKRHALLEALPDWYGGCVLTSRYQDGWNDAIASKRPYLVGCHGQMQRLAYLLGWGRQKKFALICRSLWPKEKVGR
jgi:hypothetical protein